MRGEYRHGSHTMYSIHLHIVWVTKYGKKVLKGEIANRVREIVREECRKKNVDILKGDVSAEHVHIMVSIPPHVAISRLVQHIKGKSAVHTVIAISATEASVLGKSHLGSWILLPR